MKKISYILIILLSILISNFSEAQTDFTAEKLIRKGNKEFADSNFTVAEEQYQLALLEDKTNFKAKYNLANTLFKQERFEEAAEAYEEIVGDTPDKTMKANIYHNMANSKLANKDLEGSIEDYKNALRLKPKMQDTRYNLTYAMKLKDQKDQQEQQENKDNKDQDKKDDEKKDQDNKDKQDEQDKDKDKDKKDQDKKDENSEDKNEDEKDKQDEKKQDPEEEKKQKVDKKETERLLRAVAEKEKETKEKLEKKKARVKAVKTEKDW